MSTPTAFVCPTTGKGVTELGYRRYDSKRRTSKNPRIVWDLAASANHGGLASVMRIMNSSAGV